MPFVSKCIRKASIYCIMQDSARPCKVKEVTNQKTVCEYVEGSGPDSYSRNIFRIIIIWVLVGLAHSHFSELEASLAARRQRADEGGAGVEQCKIIWKHARV